MERFSELVDREIRKLLGAEPEKQTRALELARRVFQWLNEGGVPRIEEGLKGEVALIEQKFAEKAKHFERDSA